MPGDDSVIIAGKYNKEIKEILERLGIMENVLHNGRTNKIIFICLILFECLCLSACHRPLSDDDKRRIAFDISEICLEQYEQGNCDAESLILNDKLKAWCDPDDDLYELLDNKEVKYFYAMILDENTVLVSTGGEFQSVKGYIVTDQTYELNQAVTVPDSLGYDGNLITICSDNQEGVYSFNAGL